MLPEIGSNFWITPEELEDRVDEMSLSTLGIKGNDEVLLSTGRAAQNFVLDDIERTRSNSKKVALIPPYTCYTVIDPFIRHKYELTTYPVDLSLNTKAEWLEDAIQKYNPSVVLIHRYFGFDTVQNCEDVIQKYSKQGIVFIEDRTQSLFSKYPSLPVQYITGSLRKWGGLPDGGFAISLYGKFKDKPQAYDRKLMEAKVEASLDKYAYIINGIGEKEAFLEKYRAAEDILGAEKDYYSISPISRKVFSAINPHVMGDIRRANYNFLFAGLEKKGEIHPIFGFADDMIVPLYFLIWVENRTEVQSYLRENRIYAPVVWPKAGNSPDVCSAADELYKHVLCIPVDQRYREDDMNRIVECLMQ